MRVVIRKNYEEMSKAAACFVRDEMKGHRNKFVLGLATGSTPIGLYKELIRMHKEEGLDFKNVWTFNLDEYIGIPPTHEQSYRYFMNVNLFNHVNIKKKNTHVPDGMAKNLVKHCEKYERMIKSEGGIDLQVLGIGGDGHIAFNEPGSSLGSRTRVKTLTEETIADNSKFFEKKEDVPKFAITMGVGSVLRARKCIMVANGAKKAEVVAKTIEGPVTAQVTASALQLHGDVVVFLDEEAASRLTRRAYYNHVEKMTEELMKSGILG